VLKGLDFIAREGNTTALVGPSGAGKTTVFTLLTRLGDVGSGTVSIGGTPVGEIDLDALRDGIAVVSQDSALFDETIATNIRMGRLDATEEEVREAARAASVLDFAEAMPLGSTPRSDRAALRCRAASVSGSRSRGRC
jgi:subfamily B ATP-binding cassette protein MsbA